MHESEEGTRERGKAGKRERGEKGMRESGKEGERVKREWRKREWEGFRKPLERPVLFPTAPPTPRSHPQYYKVINSNWK